MGDTQNNVRDTLDNYMYVIIMHKHSFNTQEYLASSVSLSSGNYQIVTATGTVTFQKSDYLLAIMN